MTVVKKCLHIFAAAALLWGAPQLVSAQSPSPHCSALLTADACQKTVDLFSYLSPQLGTLIAGGHPVLGQGAVLTFFGTGRAAPPVSAGIRLNFMSASIPDLSNVNFSLLGASNSTPIPVVDRMIIGPTLDAAVGLFAGFPAGAVDVMGVDLLVSAIFLPDIEEPGVRVHTAGSGLRFGYGARVALLQETIVTPSVTVSYIRRALPVVDITSQNTSGGNSVDVEVSDLDKSTDSWRVTLAKSLVGFSLAIGAGQDASDATASIVSTVNGTSTGALPLSQKVNRTSLFANGTVNIGPGRISAEVGQVFGGNISTFNSFAGSAPDAARLYGSLGVRLNF